MEKYLKYDAATLDEMLAACRDYKERQNIRSALRELKGIKLEDNSFVSLSFSSRNVNPPSSSSSVTSSSDIRSRSENETLSKESDVKQAPDLHRSSSTISNGVNGSIDQDKYTNDKDENSNEQPKFRTYLYAGRIGSPNISPKYSKKESRSPRKVHHTPITRVKVLDKSDLVDKSTETEEGDVSVKSDETDKVKDLSNTKRTSKIIRARTVDKVNRFQSTPKPGVEPLINHRNTVDLNTSAIEFSSDLDKVKGSSVLHRPVSVNIAELDCDKTNDNHTSPTSQVSNVITSPRKPRKIVSYRTSAFTPASKLNPVSSTISRARLASAPLFCDSSGTTPVESVRKPKSESDGHIDKFEFSVANNNCDVNDKQDDISESCSVANDSSVESNSIGTKLRAANEQLKKLFNSDITYRASPCAIKVGKEEDDSSLVARLRKKLESKRKKDIKSDLEEFSYFTNKMKEKHGKKNMFINGSGTSASENIVLSPVSNNTTINLGENEINEGNNTLISNYTSNKTAVTMEDKNEANLLKKKSALSRRNRVDSEEGNIYRKYRKKPKSEKTEMRTQTLKTVDTSKVESDSVFEDKEVDKSQKKVSKSSSVRRKLPDVPVKQDSDPEDDETIHERTIRLLQERRKERQEKDKIVVGKDITDKNDKSKMSPSVLKKSLEQKLEKSDSKRKAYRVRRELQLLNRENELKSGGDQSGSDDEVKSINDRSDKYYKDTFTPKCDSRASRVDRKLVQRSKSDTGFIHRRRAVSETDAIIKESNDTVDGKNETNNVLKMYEVEDNLSPVQKINMIGNLMQEEAKLQEMLRMSTNFSEKRKMRGEIRQLRQKRAAIEGTSDQPSTTRLRRSASVTAGPVSKPHHIDITRPESVCERRSENYSRQTSIEELRKQLSETQDYDEKKKIRLALRQLRQQTRDVPQSGLQRSQSFVHRKNSEPVTNGTSESNSSHVIRSQSVNEQRIPDKDSGQEFDKKREKHDQSIEDKVKVVSKENRHGNSENGSVTRFEIEKLILSRQSTASEKPPIPKTVHKHSISSSKTSDSSKTSNSLKSPESSKTLDSSSTNSQGHSVPARNSIEAVIQKFSNHSNNSSVQNLKTHSHSDSKTEQKLKNHDKDGNSDKSFGSHVSRRHSSFDVRNSIHIINSSEDSDTHKSVDLLKDTVKILENQKQKRDYTHNEVKDIDNKDHDSGSTRKSRSEHTSHDKGSGITNTRNSHILVSKAGIERDKQNRLVNLRRNRSQSELRRETNNHSKPVIHEKGSVAKKSDSDLDNVKPTIDTKGDDTLVTSSKNSDKGSKDSEIKNINEQVTVKDNAETLNEVKRLSPPLLWLEEKRKSLNTKSESDKLLSTLDIEAAFSEILGAVEDFPDQKVAMDINSTDIPIVEEEASELAEMAESAVDTNTVIVNGDIHEEAVNDVKENSKDRIEINDDTLQDDVESDILPVNGEDSKLPTVTENKKSEATIHLRNDLSLKVNSTPETNSAISVIHGDDGTVTVKEVSRVEEGDTTITEWKKIRRSQSRTETRETDTIVEKKITSPGGNSTVYEKDVSKTKHKLTSRGSNYFTRNELNIKRRTNLDGSEVVEQDLSTVSENLSVSKNESWGDKSEAHVVLHKEPVDVTQPEQKSIENGTAPITRNLHEKRLSLPGDVGSNVIQSHLGKPSGCPEITSTLDEITINEGGNVKFECIVVSFPVPDVTWYKEDSPVHENEDISISYDIDTGLACLNIKHVTVEDNAVYKCMFENPLGSASTAGRLIVNKKSSGYPMFLSDLSDVTICEGSSLCLECNVTDVEVVTWYKDGVIQRNNADFKQTFDGNKARLEIGEVFLDDCGTYACALKNSNGEKRSFCRVTVKEAESSDTVFPMFLKKPETMIADELDPVIIESEVIGSPQPVITWLLDDMKLNEDNRHRMSYDGRVAMLVVRRVTTADSGRIQCVAENSSGKVSADCMLVVRASMSPPKVCQHLSDQTTISGKNISLKCIISGEPTPEITWRKNGLVIGQMFDFKQKYIDGLAILEISKCCSQDTGCYECLATNEKGEASTSCTLTVNEEPIPVEISKPQSVPVSNINDDLLKVKDKVQEVSEVDNKDTENFKEIKHDHEPVSQIDPIAKNDLEAEEFNKLDESESLNQEIKEVPVVVEEEPKFSKEEPNYVKEEPNFIKVESNVVKKESTVVKEESDAVKEVLIIDKDTREVAEVPKVESKPTNVETEVPEKSVIEAKVSVAEEKVETAAVKEFTSNFTPKIDEEKKQTAKSQASKIMLVRNGSFKSVGNNGDKSTVNIDSIKTVKVPAKVVDNDIKKDAVVDNDKTDKKEELKAKDDAKHDNGHKIEVKSTENVEKNDIDLNKNYTNKSNANIVLKTDNTSLKVDLDNNKEAKQNEVKSLDESSKIDSLCLEDKNAKTPKRVAKFRTGGEVRRTQSVRTPGNEKPEWLQVKLRRVGNNATPSSFMREIEKQQVESSVPATSNSDKNIVEDKPVSVQRVSTLGRSQSVKTVGRTPPSALNDSTNSPSGRDSVKLTPVSERAKIFQMKDSNLNRDSSGKASPIDIISKAINLSRAESMKAPAGHRSGVVQRSQSFKTDTPSTSQRDITLELTPQKSQVGEEKSNKVERSSSVKYWDPSAPSTSKMDYSTYNDEEELGQMLSNSDNFDERKKIRARIKELRDAHMREWEAKQKAREAAAEDIIKKKHREADALKQQKLEQFKKQAAEHSEAKHLDVAEQHLREKVRIADEQKKKQLEEYNQRAAVHQESTHLEVSERALQERIKQADILKQKTLDAYDKAAGKTDGKTVTTTRRVETTTKVGGAAGKPADEIAPQLAQQIINATGNVSGVLTVKTESWSSKDKVRHTSEKTESWGGGRGAMNAFKQMDAKNPAPKTNAPGGGRPNITRSPSAIKTMLLEWCKAMTREYADTIEITNFSSCWNNGIAFCALIHHFYPEAFDFKALDPKQRRKNFELAFDTAEKYADIAPLLDVEDMVRMQKPDWKCVFTYVQSFYRKLANHERNKAAVPPSDG